ncbi:TMEM175 family protein [Hymenobacter antarcticus]|uniref:TMEM175 family protein n=1 Tax=Hymenobacter antarcticus TaxID=486270 RepID=A0ABP7PNG5_9BACT
MHKGRLEAFSDGVLAIILAIMVLEIKVPHGANFAALRPLLPRFLSYLLSFIYIGIYWNHHHHILSSTKSVNGAMLWANLHLLFWLSLVPVVTGWMGENHFARPRWPPAARCCSWRAWPTGYCKPASSRTTARARARCWCLRHWARREGPLLAPALRGRYRGQLLEPVGGGAIYVAVALMWLVPDRRIERTLSQKF